jgi:hypothetical protein
MPEEGSIVTAHARTRNANAQGLQGASWYGGVNNLHRMQQVAAGDLCVLL